MYRFKNINDFIQDKPLILIHDGKIDFKIVSQLEISSDELDEVIREHGVETYKEVKLAMLEIDGNISIISGDTSLKHSIHKRKIHKTLGNVNS
jgi:uncharacterized membrane protein YcaP (DUF421 family)